MKTRLLRTAWAAAGMLCWGSTSGHHAASANFTEEVGTLEGVVVDVFWNNPHVNYYLEATQADGSTRTWILESHNLSSMARLGWNRGTIEIGDRIRISGNLGRDGRARLLITAPELMDTLEVLE